ncbi:hypothetical protein [Clostridium sp. JN-9]|uniref:hypothetical protein n=1 Tax=Clostridium sp. JN-9 TaxID=2507159 RepID=UPI000FFE23EC|nr:hypothetical protein [Clostridium sp. JN-9]QAT39528.1 hypothetical protein EQM05_04275 [Clostridium sp. JN-9]
MIEQLPTLTSLSTDSKLDYNKEWGYFRNTNVMYLQKTDKKYRLQNIFNFITQAVNVDVNLLIKGLKSVGTDANSNYVEMLNAIYKNIRKDLFSMYLAVYGNAYLKMELDEAEQKITLKVLQSPNTDFVKDTDGNILQATYSYLQKDEKGNSTSVKEVYTATLIQKYVDGKIVEEKENKFGFVPLYHFMFTDIGEKFGANSFDHIAIQQDIINAYANVIYQIGNKMMDPIYLIKGDFSPKDRKSITTEFAKNIFEGINVLTTTPDGGIEVVSGGMENTEKALAFLDKIQQNIEQNLPELLLTKIVDKNLSGKALTMLLLGLITKIEGARENIKRELGVVNTDIYKVLVSWGKIPQGTENFCEIKFDEVFDFARADLIAEVNQELSMGLITTNIARQKLGIDWSGTENKTATQATNNGAKNSTTTSSTNTNPMDKINMQQGFIQKIINKIKGFFGAGK